MSLSRVKKLSIGLAVFFLAISTAGFAAVLAIKADIQQSLEEQIAYAKARHPEGGDETGCMIAYIEDEKLPFSSRNSMVWAIGQLADERALPALLARYDGEPCRHQHGLCQYELSKAINRCGGKVAFRYAYSGKK